jgi:hypothetical protein
MGNPNPNRDEELPLEQQPEAFGRPPEWSCRDDLNRCIAGDTVASKQSPRPGLRVSKKRPSENLSPRPLSRVPWPGDFSLATAPPAGRVKNPAISQGGVLT